MTIILSFVLVPIFAQNGSNPFELSPRLKEQATQNPSNDTKAIDAEGVQQGTSNPFDLGSQTNQPKKEETTEISKNNSTTIKNSQEANNPFDLGNETKKPTDDSIETTEAVSEKTTDLKQVSGNPFDLVPEDSEENHHTSSRKTTVNSPSIKKTIPLPKIAKKIAPASKDDKSYQQFLFRVVLFMLILLTLLVTLFRTFLSKTYQAFLNDNILSIIYRERGSILISPYTILYMMFLINAGIFAFLLGQYNQMSLANGRFLSLISSIGLVFAIFLLKHLILELLAFIFPITKEVRLYNFTIIVFGIIIGILLVPANILIAYAPSGMTSTLVYIALGLLGLIYLFRSLRGLFIANRFLLFHKFHFLLYICTVEVAPIIIFLKLLSI